MESENTLKNNKDISTSEKLKQKIMFKKLQRQPRRVILNKKEKMMEKLNTEVKNKNN